MTPMRQEPVRSGPAFLIAAGTRMSAILGNPPVAAVDTRILLAHALALSRVQLVTQSERILTEGEARHLSALFERRTNGEPIAYIVGEREFFGLSFHVTPDVLIPRPETELLVELALERLPENGRVLDLGTGSGAIAVAIAHARPDAAVTAIDSSTAALAIARRNVAQHGVHVAVLQSDWYHALGDRQFDVIVANPPYIAAGDPHLSQGDLRFEPANALTDHADGLSALQAIARGAARHLAPRGRLLLEHGYDQSSAVRALLERQGFSEVQSWKDLAGIERATGGAKETEPVP
jgi:release factor glutamine methyltransferase